MPWTSSGWSSRKQIWWQLLSKLTEQAQPSRSIPPAQHAKHCCKAQAEQSRPASEAEMQRWKASEAAYLMQIVDELSQVLNGVDVVVGRG